MGKIKPVFSSAMFGQIIPSFLTIGFKFTAGLGLFFLIGNNVSEEVFAQFIVLLSLSTFVGYFVDFGFLLKLTTDFPTKGIGIATLESYYIRLILLTIVLLAIYMLSFIISVDPLFFCILLNVVIGFFLESTSIQLRYQGKYWMDACFVFTALVLPVLGAIYFLFQSESLKFIYFWMFGIKFFCFLPIFFFWLFRSRSEISSLKDNFYKSVSFALDSLLLNAQPFLQLQAVALFFPPAPLGFFAYAQKIIQGFSVLFSAFNNVFFPKLVKARGNVHTTSKLLKIFILSVSVLPMLVLCFFLIRGTGDLGLIINDIYEEYFFNIFIVMFIVIVKFNSGVIGSVLTANGHQKRRLKINSMAIVIETILLVALLGLMTTAVEMSLLVVLLSCVIVLISYVWVVKNENVITLPFSFAKKT